MTQQLLDPPKTVSPSSRWTWPIRGLAAIVATAVLAFGVLTVIGIFMRRTETQTRFFAASVHQVRVKTSDGNVRIRTGVNQRGATVTSTNHSSFRTAQHTETLTGDVLEVSSACRGGLFVADACSVDLEITVAPGTIVNASTTTGSISVTATHGPVTARSSTGDVQVSQAKGAVVLTTSVGDVTGELLDSAQVRSHSQTGDIRLSFTTAPQQIRANTDIGDIRILVPDDTSAYRVRADVSLGDRHIDVPTDPASPRTADLSTNTGDIRMALLSR
jgi:DUF4097 and DUF4098 domain-containing protein YvlB